MTTANVQLVIWLVTQAAATLYVIAQLRSAVDDMKRRIGELEESNYRLGDKLERVMIQMIGASSPPR